MTEQKNTALVTGASSGIGLEISRELARRGYSLLMVSNEGDKLAAAAQEIESEYGIKTVYLCMDLAQRDSAQILFDYCQANQLSIDILINNAGIFFFKDVIETPIVLMETIINLHVHTPAMLARLFAQKMVEEKKNGYILNIASVSSAMMMPGIALYSGTKSFLRSFSRAMRHEILDKGISITTIRPGAVATNLYNLPPRFMKLGIRLGIIMKTERLAYLAIKKMLKRKVEYIPGGFINRLFIFIVLAMPERLIRRIRKKVAATKFA